MDEDISVIGNFFLISMFMNLKRFYLVTHNNLFNAAMMKNGLKN